MSPGTICDTIDIKRIGPVSPGSMRIRYETMRTGVTKLSGVDRVGKTGISTFYLEGRIVFSPDNVRRSVILVNRPSYFTSYRLDLQTTFTLSRRRDSRAAVRCALQTDKKVAVRPTVLLQRRNCPNFPVPALNEFSLSAVVGSYNNDYVFGLSAKPLCSIVTYRATKNPKSLWVVFNNKAENLPSFTNRFDAVRQSEAFPGRFEFSTPNSNPVRVRPLWFLAIGPLVRGKYKWVVLKNLSNGFAEISVRSGYRLTDRQARRIQRMLQRKFGLALNKWTPVPNGRFCREFRN